MIALHVLIGAIVTILVFIYTVSYGIWTWKKQNNKTGAVAVFGLALAVLILPIFAFYARH